ncbi:hypothetical protein KKD03_02585 [Patescibacteria group bacterium]|nr:hypothetical protein [Patescibacteria group bacterium]
MNKGTNNRFLRGSVWRKWDLHIHTPETKKNNNYRIEKGGDIWNEFCKKIEASDIKVFGITDYFSIDNYLLFINKFKKKYPNSEKIFFPNIELSIDRSSNNRNEGYDFHLIFDNKIQDKDLHKFLGNLRLENTDNNGRNLKASELESEASFKSAFTTLLNLEEALKDTFGDKKPYLKVLMAHGHGGVQPEKGNSRKNAVAEESDKRVADIYFGRDIKDSNFFLNVRGKVKKKKPCVTGSDAHSFEEFDRKVGKEFTNSNEQRRTLPTWIKADKTFEGLKQILYEPQERVFLGNTPEKLIDVESNRSKYIDFVKIVHSKDGQEKSWFNDEISLNPGLVAVIGRKGQGKSALIDIVAFCGKTKISPNDYSFLRKDKFRKKGIAKDYTATLKWCDGQTITENLDSEVDITEVEKVKYLPQKYVETICSDDGVSEQFQQEIDKVIFSYIPEEGRLNSTNLADLISVKTETIDTRISQFRSNIHSINDKIVKLENKKRPEYLQALEKKLVARQKELEGLVKPKTVVPPKAKLKKIDQNKLNGLTKRIVKINTDIDLAKASLKTTNEKINKLGKLKAAVEELSASAKKIVKEFDSDAKLLSIDLSKLINIKVNEEALTNTEQQLLEQQEHLEELLDQNDISPDKSLYSKKVKLETKKAIISGTLGKGQERYSGYQKQLEEYKTKKEKIEGSKNDSTLETINSIMAELAYLKGGLNDDLQALIIDRVSLVEKLYSCLEEKSDFYKKIYRPLLRFITAEEGTQKDSGSMLGFDAGIVFDSNTFSSKFLRYINQGRDGSFQYKTEGQKVLGKIVESAEFSTVTGIKDFTNELINHLEYHKGKKPEEKSILYTQLKGEEKENIDFYNFTFGLEYLDVRYKVLFNGKDLNSNEFSPGEKGALLLIFYLLIDKDHTPLIMDQPEENLDNESVYELLVPYIRKAKLKRQIIIVTHNPNLAVVCDAEQIITASMDKKKSQIRYTFGSIENPELNKKASDILEGTLPAFDKRDEKYIRQEI